MTLLDASAVTSIFLEDAHTPRVRHWLRQGSSRPTVSSFAATEFAAVVSRRIRIGLTNEADALGVLRLFDAWLLSRAEAVEVEPQDHPLAALFVRRFALGLRAPDALHLATCQRLGLPLLTFDLRQAAAAIALGIACDPAGATGGA